MAERSLIELYEPTDISADGICDAFVANGVFRCTIWKWQYVIGFDDPQPVAIARFTMPKTMTRNCIEQMHNAVTFGELLIREIKHWGHH